MKKLIIIVLIISTGSIFGQIADPGRYTIENVSVNTKYSDFGTTFFGKEKVVFASPKEGAVITKTTWGGNDQPFLDLFLADIDTLKGELKNKKKVLGDVNNKFHEGIVAFTNDLKTVYFDANNYSKKGKAVKDSTGTVNIQLYKADVLENGEWRNVVKLPFNSDQYSTGHPTVSADDKKLYFISDRPGSIGKTDIFVVDILPDGTYSYPKNMGPKINTPEREMFPFISDDKFLYFSSDGHEGYGELDVFACKIFDNTVSKAINLESPINSTKDDFAYIIDDSNNKGYFSSNRDGGKGDDDIYALTADPPIQIEGKQAISGIVRDVDSGEIIPGATITLLDDKGNVVAEETLPTEIGDWKPYKNSQKVPNKDISISSGKIENLEITKRVDKENPELAEDAEFTIDFENKGRKTIKEIKLDDVIPEGYEYVDDNENRNIQYDPKTNTIKVKELKKGEKLSIKIKTKVLPKEKGAFSFDAISNKDYKVVIKAPSYLEETIDVRTDNDTDIPPLEVKIKMDPELRVVNEKIMININTIYFDFDKSNIRPDAAIELDKVVEVMKNHPTMMIEAGSHTDSRATESYNQILSEKRAKATLEYIVAKGIDRSRIRAKGYGEMQLVNNCSSFVKCTRKQHQLNRRTEFVIVNDEEKLASTNATIDNVLIDKSKNATYVDLDNVTSDGAQIVNASTKDQKIDGKESNTTKSEVVKGTEDQVAENTGDTKIEEEVSDSNKTNPFSGSVVPKSQLNKFITIAPIFYEYDSWSLSAKEKKELDRLVNLMKSNSSIIVEAQVHTDAINSENHNNLLSTKRARSIVSYMKQKGIRADRIFGVGYGEKIPVNKCKNYIKCSQTEHQANRRIEFVVIAGNGYPKNNFINKGSNRFINTNPIYFDYDKYSLRKDAIYELDRVVNILKENASLKIEAGSHTDSNNTEAYNQKLSEKRAKTVRDYLISKGIKASRITSKGYGEMQLINDCSSFVKCTPEQHRENRRTEFKIINN